MDRYPYPSQRTEAPSIDADVVRRLIAAQMPRWAHLPVRAVRPGGWDNRTFRLGEAMKVRLPSRERYVLQVEKEARWLPRLAPHLPLPIPDPLAVGGPGEGYPWPWSVMAWLEGEPVTAPTDEEVADIAADLAAFLLALQTIDAADGPAAGPHNFFRGGALSVYDEEARRAIAALEGRIDASAAREVWDEALASAWSGAPVWVHGDVARGNLLVADGRLAAVIDFGGLGVGDPACDLTIAWTLLRGRSRETFRSAFTFDDATWARARGWALWKAAIDEDLAIVREVLAGR